MTFLGEFVRYLKSRTDAPPDFHLHAGLAALSVAAGNHVYADGWARNIYPNLWTCVIAPSGMGKALALDTPIATPRGWTTMGELRVGDEVFGVDGRPTRVRWVSPVWLDRDLYLVETKEGATVVADADHLWRATIDNKTGPKLYTSAVLARQRNHRARIERPAALELPDSDLPVGPYTVGAWLGDGHTYSGMISGVGDDLAHVRNRVEAEGYRTTERVDKRGFGIPGLFTQLYALGLGRNKHGNATTEAGRLKHIPEPYLRASRAQRLALMQGLIDTDGYVSPVGDIEFCTTVATLADGVMELAASLGTKVNVTAGRATLNGRDCGPKYRVRFYLPDAASLPRKAARCRFGVRTQDHYVRVTPAGRGATRCITVEDPSGMFLAGRRMLPTHNSVPLDMAAGVIDRAGLSARVLPESFSQEGLWEALRKESSGIFLLQEFSAFMGLLAREYNAGAQSWLTSVFDVPLTDRRMLRGQTIELKLPCITILGASSPDWFAESFKASSLRGGFLARFLFCPSREPGAYVGHPGPRDEGLETVLADHLRQVSEQWGKADFSAVWPAFNAWDRRSRERVRMDCPPEFAGMRSRAGVLVLKSAILFHLSRRPRDLRIETEDLENAIKFVERSHRLAEAYLAEEVPQDRDEGDRLKVLEILRRAEGHASRSKVLKDSHLSSRRLDAAVETLRQSERLEVARDGKTVIYRIAQEARR